MEAEQESDTGKFVIELGFDTEEGEINEQGGALEADENNETVDTSNQEID